MSKKKQKVLEIGDRIIEQISTGRKKRISFWDVELFSTYSIASENRFPDRPLLSSVVETNECSVLIHLFKHVSIQVVSGKAKVIPKRMFDLVLKFLAERFINTGDMKITQYSYVCTWYNK